MPPPGPTLLIVEDEMIIALDAEAMTEQAGFHVVGNAVSGREAIVLADLLQPDVALVDVNLLDGPMGVTVGRHLSDRLDTLVIFTTASREMLPADLCGAGGVITKPYADRSFREALEFIRAYVTGAPLLDGVPSALELGERCRDYHQPAERRRLPRWRGPPRAPHDHVTQSQSPLSERPSVKPPKPTG